MGEQQAQIIADYYVLQAYGYREWNIQRRKGGRWSLIKVFQIKIR